MTLSPIPLPKPTSAPEEIIDAALPIIDPHHHLWDYRWMVAGMPTVQHPFEYAIRWASHYFVEELLADAATGHNIVATVFIECGAMYRADGPDAMKPVGETEFANGQAAISASGIHGPARACAGIVAHADLFLGAAVGEVLDAHMAASSRFRGIRHSPAFDADSTVLGPLARRPGGIMMDARYREGFAELGKRGLTYDAWLLEPQLPEVIDLARAFPDQAIVLDHVGTPLGLASYQGKLSERFHIWRDNIRELAKCQNVSVKLGGLAMPFCNFPSTLAVPRPSSTQLAAEWRPYIETCIEAFGAKRAMFESNFPVDQISCPYDRLWNAMKIIAKNATPTEKADLFHGTAKRFYRLEV